jgi:hypothetical protein
MEQRTEPVAEELPVDRAIYLVDRTARTYRYERRNPGSAELDPAENERHKRSLVGYVRILPDGRRKVFAYRPPSCRRCARGAGAE